MGFTLLSGSLLVYRAKGSVIPEPTIVATSLTSVVLLVLSTMVIADNQSLTTLDFAEDARDFGLKLRDGTIPLENEVQTVKEQEPYKPIAQISQVDDESEVDASSA